MKCHPRGFSHKKWELLHICLPLISCVVICCEDNNFLKLLGLRHDSLVFCCIGLLNNYKYIYTEDLVQKE